MVSVCLKIKTVRVHARRNATQRVHVHERHADRSHTSWLPSLLKKLKRQTRQVRKKGNILTSCLRRREPMVVKTMSIQIHNSRNMQIFRSSQFQNCVSQNHKIATMQIITVVSTTMSQYHEITKLHIFQVIVGTTMTRSNCKFRSLMVFSPTMSMHQIAP